MMLRMRSAISLTVSLTFGGSPLHTLSVAHRGRGDMTIWVDGGMDGAGRTPRLEWDRSELFPVQAVPALSHGGLLIAAGLMFVIAAAVQRCRGRDL